MQMWHLKKVNKGRIFPQQSFFCAQMWVVGRYFYIILNKPLGLFWYWVTSHVCDFGCHKKASESLFCCRKRTITLLPNQLLPDPPRKKKKVIWSKSLCTLCQKYTLDRNLNVFFPTEQHAVHLLSLAECLFQEWDDLPHLLRTHQLF